MAFGTAGNQDPYLLQTYLHRVLDLNHTVTVTSDGTLVPNYLSASEAPVAAWNESRWAIAGPSVSFTTFKTEDEAVQQAKLLTGKSDNIHEVLVFKVLFRVRPVPKEVEVVGVKD